MVLHPDGYQLKINLVLNPNLPSSSYFEEDGKWFLDTGVLDFLPPFYGSIQKVILHVTFPPPGTLTADNQKSDYSWLIREMSKSINNFKGLNCLHIKYKMPVRDWDQLKTAAYFYRLEFQRWTFRQSVGEGGWAQLRIGSRLERRLTSFAVKLIEREQEKERAEQESGNAERTSKEKVLGDA